MSYIHGSMWCVYHKFQGTYIYSSGTIACSIQWQWSISDTDKSGRCLTTITVIDLIHGTSWNGNAFRNTGFLWGEFIGNQWIPPTKAGTFSIAVLVTWTICWKNSGVLGALRHHDTRVTTLFICFVFRRRIYAKTRSDVNNIAIEVM